MCKLQYSGAHKKHQTHKLFRNDLFFTKHIEIEFFPEFDMCQSEGLLSLQYQLTPSGFTRIETEISAVFSRFKNRFSCCFSRFKTVVRSSHEYWTEFSSC